jgi:pimeloyl-ACP methyl ester carboxylesterase
LSVAVPDGTHRTPAKAARVGPRFRELPVLGPTGFYRLAYADWGPPDAHHVVVLVHGVSRNGHDFDFLAADLAARGIRAVAPDLPGRGRSDWLTSGAHYDNEVYLPAMGALIARLGVPHVDWVGTSLGGYIGMAVAALPNNPIRRLVLNDFGARVAHAALRRIATYLRVAPKFRDVGAAEVYLREVLAPFGALTDAQWQHITRHSLVKRDKGWGWHYDPAIANNFSLLIAFDVVLWHLWDEIACPTLILRGEDSDLLAPRTVDEMLRRGHAAAAGEVTVVEWPGCGHAPSLMADDQIACVRDFLLEP